MDSQTISMHGSRWVKRSLTGIALGAGFVLAVAGCSKYQTKPTAPAIKYISHPDDPSLPLVFKGTVRDKTILANVGNFPVTNWGLVVGLRGTGDSTCPSLVREWMIKEMQVHRFGLASAGTASLTPEEVLNDPHVAVVGVMANIPPGARKGDYVDAIVQAMPGNNTTSLANGTLYRSELKINGISDPVGAVNLYAKAQGNLFVNPAYAANSNATTKPVSRTSLRTAVIPNGTLVMTDRPIHLVMRSPSWASSRAIEERINAHFQTVDRFRDATALAQDEGYLHLMLPHKYHGDWQHFVGIVQYLYLNNDPAFVALKAKQLAEEALKPDSPLMEISYAWEGLGPVAMPFITPLMSNPQQDVQFAAARAAAFLGDSYGVDRLVQIAATPGHAFQINAVQTLGEMQASEAIDAQLARLMDSDQSLVRIEAYKVLCDHGSAHIFSKPIYSKLNPENEFILDLVNSSGPPLVYCSTIGRPRVAIFGRRVSMQTPVLFSAFDARLTIANLPEQPHLLNLFYRDEMRRNPIQALSGPDLGELVARLGGATDDGFHFNYADIVAILQTMADQKTVAAAFVLQRAPEVTREIQAAPSIQQESRPQTDAPTATNSQLGASLPDLRPTPQQPKMKTSTSERPQ